MDRFETLQHRDEDSRASDADGSLVVFILDTNPSSWAALTSTTLSQTLADVLIFLNAHLALNQANEAAVIASHSSTARFLYPSAPSATNSHSEERNLKREANGYKPFLQMQDQVTANLRSLLDSTTPSSSSTSTMSGAMTLGLSYINKRTRSKSMTSRMTILSLSGDLEAQYIPMMNAIFSAQRQHVVMDVLRVGDQEAVFLQQAADATKGLYRALGDDESVLACLMMLYLPDGRVRNDLVMPPAQQVDFRAACFCHKRVLDVGFVCSVCLSIFCQALPKCITCDADFDMQEMKAFGAKPAVLVKKKKRKENGTATLQHQDSVVID